MPKKIWSIIIGSIIAVVALPLAIDWLIIGNSVPSNISNSDWVGFFGGYIGSILGCIISLIGILWTINFTREQNRADRELQIRPYFDIRYAPSTNTLPNGVAWLGYVNINEFNEEYADSKSIEKGLLLIKNVGNGPATNINAEVSLADIKVKYNAVFTNQNSRVTTNSIRQGEEAAISFFIYSNCVTPSKDDLSWDENGFVFYDLAKFPAPSPYKMSIRLKFSDLLGNVFYQELKFNVGHGIICDEENGSKCYCDLLLVEKGSPQKK